jgi:hypothetical protein
MAAAAISGSVGTLALREGANGLWIHLPLVRLYWFSWQTRIHDAGGFIDQEARLMLDQGISKGRGGLFLNLTEEQYARLRGM